MADPIDDFIALPQDQQLSTLNQLAPDKQDKLLAQVKSRRSASSANIGTASAVPDDRNFIQKSIDNLSTVLPGDRRGNSPIVNAAQDVGAGVIGSTAGVLAHPLKTLKSMMPETDANGNLTPLGYGEAALGPAGPSVVNMGMGIYDAFKNHPLREAIPNLAGQLIGGELTGEAGGAAVRAVPKAIGNITRGTADLVAGTGPRATGKMISDVAEDNAAATQKAQASNAADLAKAAQKRQQQINDHFDKLQEVKSHNAAQQNAVDRRAALERGVETLDPQLKEHLQSTYENAKTEANRRYNELNTNLDPVEAPQDTLGNLLQTFGEKIKGSNTEPTIVNDMEKRFNSNEPLTYRDLQGYRSEIGNALNKGGLAGDVYNGYKSLQEGITDAMQKIADQKGMGSQFKDARSYYRDYADTFLDPSNPARKALDSGERGGVVGAYKGKDQTGIQAIAKYDPELAKRLNTVRGYQKQAAVLPKKASLKVEPVLDEAAPVTTVQADTTPITPESIQQMKQNAILTRADKIRNGSNHLATAFTALDAIRNAMHGNVAGIAEDVGARALYSGGKAAVASALEHPKVVQWLSQPTAADLAALDRLPPEQHAQVAAELRPVITAARAKGIKVSPAVLAIVGAAQTLPAGHPLAQTQ